MAKKVDRIKVVPHFMRLHEWIALEEGFFAAEGLAPETDSENMHAISTHGADPYKKRPQDKPYLDGEEVCSSACHWAVPMNAGAGMGKFVPDMYGVARFAIFARPGSPTRRIAELANVPVGVGLMAGSHFATLVTLESVLPKSQIKTANVGGPGRRLLALLNGEVEAATLLDPEIPMAEAKGLVKIAQGEFKTLFWVAPTMAQHVLDAFFRVLRRADEALRRTPAKYMHLWANNIPPSMKGDYDYADFGLGEMMIFEQYTQAEYDETLKLARRWDLADHLHAGAHQIDNIAYRVTL